MVNCSVQKCIGAEVSFKSVIFERTLLWSMLGIDPSAGFLKKIWLAEPFFRLISGLAEFLRKLQNSAENTAEHQKFG